MGEFCGPREYIGRPHAGDERYFLGYCLRIERAENKTPEAATTKTKKPKIKISESSIGYGFRIATWKKAPRLMIDGTQMPTNIPASLLAAIPMPNHREIEKRNERKAASKMSRSPLASMKTTLCRNYELLQDELAERKDLLQWPALLLHHRVPAVESRKNRGNFDIARLFPNSII